MSLRFRPRLESLESRETPSPIGSEPVDPTVPPPGNGQPVDPQPQPPAPGDQVPPPGP